MYGLLKDKIILVTGSTNGLGAAIARECVAQGAKVMVHGRAEDKAKAMVEELGGSSVAAYVISDFTSLEAYQTLVPATIKKFGRLDGIVNNAGISPRNTIDTVTVPEIDRIMHTNLYAPMLVTQSAMPQFRKQKHGTIVNIGSMNSYCGQTDLLAYSCSKGALMTMTRNLADALGTEGIRVNQLNIGWVPTPNEIELKRKEGLPADWPSRIPKAFAPSGRLGTPENVASHVVFWLSPASGSTSGAVYEVEEYPIIGRNPINFLDLSKVKE